MKHFIDRKCVTKIVLNTIMFNILKKKQKKTLKNFIFDRDGKGMFFCFLLLLFFIKSATFRLSNIFWNSKIEIVSVLSNNK